MTKQEFAKAMAVLSGAVVREMPKETMQVWYQILGHLPYEQLQAGILKTIREKRYAGFPEAGEILRNSGGGDMPAPDKAVAAWDLVIRAIREIGGYRSVKFDDPLINAAVRSLGGWIDLTNRTTEELVWARKEFLDLYRAFLAGGITQEQAAPLAGIVDQTNSREGHSGGVDAVPVGNGLPAPNAGLVRGEPVKPKALPASREVRRLVESAGFGSIADD